LRIDRPNILLSQDSSWDSIAPNFPFGKKIKQILKIEQLRIDRNVALILIYSLFSIAPLLQIFPSGKRLNKY